MRPLERDKPIPQLGLHMSWASLPRSLPGSGLDHHGSTVMDTLIRFLVFSPYTGLGFVPTCVPGTYTLCSPSLPTSPLPLSLNKITAGQIPLAKWQLTFPSFMKTQRNRGLHWLFPFPLRDCIAGPLSSSCGTHLQWALSRDIHDSLQANGLGATFPS